MKTTNRIILATAMITAVFALTSADAQPGSGGRNFDPKTVETIAGKIVSIDKPARPQGRGYGVHLTLENSKETISIHLGPYWYLEKQTPQLQANDAITVIGS